MPAPPATNVPAVLQALPGGTGTKSPAAELNGQAQKIEELLQKAQSLRDPAARVLVQECLQSVLSLYGKGLERLVQILQESGAEGEGLLARLAMEPFLSGLLLIHGLHPQGLETRVRQALARVRPYVESHGGKLELLGLQNDFARLRMAGTCSTCPASALTLESVVRRALEETCPDLAGFDVEGIPKPEEPALTH